MKNRKKNSPDLLEEETKNPRCQRISVGSRRPNRLLRLTTVVLSVLGGAGAMENRKPVNDASGNSPAIPSDPPSSVDSFNLDPSFAFLSPDLKYWVDQEDEDDEDNDEDQDALSISNHEKALKPKSTSTEILINTYLTGNQTESAFVEFPTGDRLYVWSGVGFEDTTPPGIYARRRYANGSWSDQFLVNEVMLREQNDPTVEVLPNGSAVIAYNSRNNMNYYGVNGRIYDPNIESLSNEFTIYAYSNDHHLDVDIGVFPNGDFVAVWVEKDSGTEEVFGGIFQADGTRIGNICHDINSETTSPQLNPRVKVLSNGNFITVWEDQHLTNGIRSRTYQPNWTEDSAEAQIAADGANTLHHPDVADLGNNRVVFVWDSDTSNGIHASVRGYDANPISSAQNILIHERTGNTQTHPRIIPTGDDLSGGKLFVCTWKKDGEIYARQMRLYQDQLSPVGHEFQVNEYTTGLQERPSIRHLDYSDPESYVFGITWSGEGQGDPHGIFFREFDPIPEIINNQLTVIEGETITLTSNEISITDFDNNADEITITVSGVTNGQFEHSGNPGTPITDFTQDEADNNLILFVHDGSTNAPSYNLTATDGTFETEISSGTINFTPLTHSSTYTTSSSWWNTVTSWFSGSSSEAETSSPPSPSQSSSFESITSQLGSSSEINESDDNTSLLWSIVIFLGGGVAFCALTLGAVYFYNRYRDKDENDDMSSTKEIELGNKPASQTGPYGYFLPQEKEEIVEPESQYELQRAKQPKNADEPDYANALPFQNM